MADFKTGDLAACRLDGQSDYFLFARHPDTISRGNANRLRRRSSRRRWKRNGRN